MQPKQKLMNQQKHFTSASRKRLAIDFETLRNITIQDYVSNLPRQLKTTGLWNDKFDNTVEQCHDYPEFILTQIREGIQVRMKGKVFEGKEDGMREEGYI